MSLVLTSAKQTSYNILVSVRTCGEDWIIDAKLHIQSRVVTSYNLTGCIRLPYICEEFLLFRYDVPEASSFVIYKYNLNDWKYKSCSVVHRENFFFPQFYYPLQPKSIYVMAVLLNNTSRLVVLP